MAKNNKKRKRVNLSPQECLERAADKSLLKKLNTMGNDWVGQKVTLDVTPEQPKVSTPPATPVGVTGAAPDQGAKKKRSVKSGSGVLLLTVADLCKLLNVSRSTITRMDRTGSIPGRIMLGGAVRYHRELVEKWLLNMAESGKSVAGGPAIE